MTVATSDDRTRILDSLVMAFAADPVLRFLFPASETYPRYARAFFGGLFDKRVDHATIWTVERGAAVSMWDSPAAGGHPANDLASQLPADALERVSAYDAAVHDALPASPFWYLGVLGTHPDYAGRRWGRAVMAAGLSRAAADGLPAVLETSNPGNVELYRRSGWRVDQTLSLPPLTIWIMRRDW